MLGGTFQSTLTVTAEEVLGGQCATVTTQVTTTGSGLTGCADALVIEAQYEAAVLWCVGLHLYGSDGWLDAVAATLALTEGALVLVSLCAVRLTGVEDIDVTSQDLLIDGGADGTAALMRITVLEWYAADYLGAGLKDDLMYELLQGLLGLGVGGEELLKDLLLLYYCCVIYFKSEHTIWVYYTYCKSEK